MTATENTMDPKLTKPQAKALAQVRETPGKFGPWCGQKGFHTTAGGSILEKGLIEMKMTTLPNGKEQLMYYPVETS